MNNYVLDKFSTYPENISKQLLILREIIFNIALQEQLGEVEETLKWGEPSYKTTFGSPIRLAYKANDAQQFCVYFNCRTILVRTFKEIFPDTFQFVGNREITFSINNQICEDVKPGVLAVFPMAELRVCLTMALRYHKIKHLPLLNYLH
ncbi:MAG: DUF1801 domain-containing protein [Oceanospirillaceae bacterium]